MEESDLGKGEHRSVRMETHPNTRGPPRTAKVESSKKATNKDLPLGAQPMFCHGVVPSIWHWAGGQVADPFHIDESEMVNALDFIWTAVYDDDVPFVIPPTVSVVCKALPFWQFAKNLSDQSTTF
jgi:hypothetical protein